MEAKTIIMASIRNEATVMSPLIGIIVPPTAASIMTSNFSLMAKAKRAR